MNKAYSIQKFEQSTKKYDGDPREKDYYKVVYHLLVKKKISTVLDIGTASGDLLYFLPDHINALGIDKNQSLINTANLTRKKDNIEFKCEDIMNLKRVNFDCITILGTLITFMNFRPVLDKCIAMQPKLIIINDFFNPNGIDVQVGYRMADDNGLGYQFPYNIISLQTIAKYLDNTGVTYSITPYQMTSNLKRDIENPTYNYHVNLDGERLLTNGLGLILRGFNIVIELN
jgi:hypothetical protein